MSAYRRNLIAGGTYFFTVNLAERRLSLLTDNTEFLRAAFRYIRHRHPFMVDTIVVLPDHLHALWTLPSGDSDFATRWRLIKTRFSRGLSPTERISASRSRKGERGIWQRRFWEHTIRDDGDFSVLWRKSLRPVWAARGPAFHLRSSNGAISGPARGGRYNL